MSNKKLNAIKQVMQEYWENLPSQERRWILSHLVTHKQLPTQHAIFKEDDLPYACVKAWLEEVISKKDWDQEYAMEPCCC